MYSELARQHAHQCPTFRNLLLSFLPKQVNHESPANAHGDIGPTPIDGNGQVHQIYVIPEEEDASHHHYEEVEIVNGAISVTQDQHIPPQVPVSLFASPVPVSVAGAGGVADTPQGNATHYADPATEKRAQKRVANSEPHGQVCAKANKVEVVELGPVRHFAKARKAPHGVSPLVEQSAGIHVHKSTNGVQQTVQTTHHTDNGEKVPVPEVCHRESGEQSPHAERESGEVQQIASSGSELPAMLQDYDEDTNTISISTQKIIRDGRKSIQTL